MFLLSEKSWENMIFLMCSHSRLCMAALMIFYTCAWIPFLQLKKMFLKTLGFVFPWYIQAEEANVCLPVARFGDLKLCLSGGRIAEDDNDEEEEEEKEVCSICLVKFEIEDVVSQLERCRHVFHMKCIEKWLERDQFICPICRCFLFANVNSNDHAKCGSGTNLHTLLSSWPSL